MELSAVAQNELARAYQNGNAGALVDLMKSLNPILTWAVRSLRVRFPALPSMLDSEDLSQEAWIITERLIKKWNAEQGTVGGYVHVALPWELYRFCSRFSTRRAKSVQVVSTPHDTLMASMGTTGDEDSPLSNVMVEDTLRQLDPTTARLLRTVVIDGCTLVEAAKALGIGLRKAFVVYNQGLAILRVDQPQTQKELASVLAVLYETARARQIRGRLPLCQALEVSETTYYEKVAQLQHIGLLSPALTREAPKLTQPTLARALEVLHTFA